MYRKILKECSHFNEQNIFRALLAFANKSELETTEDKTGELMLLANQCLRDDNFDVLEKINTGESLNSEWNAENFLKACNDVKNKIDWQKVMSHLDCSDLFFESQGAFNL